MFGNFFLYIYIFFVFLYIDDDYRKSYSACNWWLSFIIFKRVSLGICWLLVWLTTITVCNDDNLVDKKVFIFKLEDGVHVQWKPIRELIERLKHATHYYKIVHFIVTKYCLYWLWSFVRVSQVRVATLYTFFKFNYKWNTILLSLCPRIAIAVQQLNELNCQLYNYILLIEIMAFIPL